MRVAEETRAEVKAGLKRMMGAQLGQQRRRLNKYGQGSIDPGREWEAI